MIFFCYKNETFLVNFSNNKNTKIYRQQKNKLFLRQCVYQSWIYNKTHIIKKSFKYKNRFTVNFILNTSLFIASRLVSDYVFLCIGILESKKKLKPMKLININKALMRTDESTLKHV